MNISNCRLNYCINKKSNAGQISPDKRGKTTPNKTTALLIRRIVEFLDKIPKYKSHYSDSKKQYFSPDLNRQKLYDMYKENQQTAGRSFCSKPVFCKELSSYNIGFYVPKTDTCLICDEAALKGKYLETEDEKLELHKKLTEHHARAEQARQCLRETTCEAKGNRSLIAFTFDMQSTKPIPKLNTSVVFYKRQLWVYNLGIHTLHDDQGIMAMWTENEGKRGSKEVCSAILAFLKNVDLQNVRKIRTFSDCCGGLNRNKTIISFFMWVCDNFDVEEWEHIYMESGHSYLPNDRDFGLIEKKCRTNSCYIYTKEDMIKLVAETMVRRPFKVINMRNKFVNIEDVLNSRSYNNKKTNDSTKFNFLKLKSFSVRKNSSIVRYTTDASPHHSFEWDFPYIQENKSLELAEQEVINPISKEKYDDLISILPLVPSIHQHFYKNLHHQ